MIRVIDYETTGTNEDADAEIIETGSYDLVQDETNGVWRIESPVTWLVKPSKSIPPVARAVHHISDADVADVPLLRDVIDDVLTALRSAPRSMPPPVGGDEAGKGVVEDAGAAGRGFPASEMSPPVISGEVAGGDYPPIEYEDMMTGWVPDYEASFLEPQMDKSDDLI